jgi:RND family efflux transporter MFP subunit
MIEVLTQARVSLLRVVRVTIAIAITASLAACGERATQQAKPHPVLVTTVHNLSSEYERTFSAVVRARYESDQGFRTGGKVIARTVEVGQKVIAGQSLARLDPADYELAVRSAEEQLRAAQVDAEQAASDEARLRRLLADHSVSVADHERQKARSDAATARQAQALRQLDLARNRMKYTTLVAEFDGVITSIGFEVGQVVAQGAPVITVASLSELEVVADLPEEMAGGVDAMAASATFSAAPTLTIPLRLRELSPVASTQTRTYRARFSILDKSPTTRQALHIGMTSNLHLTQKIDRPAAVLPATAVWKADGESMIWQVNNSESKLVARPVEVIRYSDEAVLVQGLSDGAKVVSAGIQKMTSGLEVVPVERSASGLDLAIPPVQTSVSEDADEGGL